MNSCGKIPVAARDPVAALVHVMSAVGLALAAIQLDNKDGIDTNDQFWLDFKKSDLHARRWYCEGTQDHCKSNAAKFHVRPPDGALPRYVPVIWLALAYAFWSGSVHVMTYTYTDPLMKHDRSGSADKPTWPSAARWIKWVDYCATAPTMLVVIGVLFGVVSPILVGSALLLFLLLVAAGLLEDRKPSNKFTWFALLCVLYVLAWVPLFVAWHDITQEHKNNDDNVQYGTAPAFVPVFGAVMFLFFSSFAGIYCYNVLKGEGVNARVARYYYAASLISKTSLHLFLGLSALTQAHTLGVNDDTDARPMSEANTLTAGLVGSLVIVIFLSALSCCAFETEEEEDQRELKQSLLRLAF